MPREKSIAVMERSAVEDITPFLPGDTVAYLRIADGDSRFPFRPISPGLFLIGNGRSCDLRLGNQDVPAIHSVVQINSHSAEITRVGACPELIVNGEEVDRSQLRHGDIIEIGDVRFIFATCVAESAEKADNSDVLSNAENVFATASDLIDKIETEFLMIESEDSKHDRVRELLHAAQQSMDSSPFAETIRFADYKDQLQSAETASSALEAAVFEHMKTQQVRLDEICEVLEQVVRQQQLIASAMQSLVEQIDSQRTGAAAPNTRRASA